jgi:hypothetical protein
MVANLWAFIDDHDEQFDPETNTFVCAGCKRRTNEGSSGDETLIGDNCCDTCWMAVQHAARRTGLAIAMTANTPSHYRDPIYQRMRATFMWRNLR